MCVISQEQVYDDVEQSRILFRHPLNSPSSFAKFSCSNGGILDIEVHSVKSIDVIKTLISFLDINSRKCYQLQFHTERKFYSLQTIDVA